MTYAPSAMPKRGQTWGGGNPQKIADPSSQATIAAFAGTEMSEVPGDTRTGGGALRNRQHGRRNGMIFVKNATGAVLAAGELVNWSTTARGTQVAAKSTGISQANAGFVDDQLEGTVPANDWFWLIRSGPLKAIMVDGTYAVNEALDPNATGGKLSTGTTYDVNTVAIAEEAKTTSGTNNKLNVYATIGW
jgi:hypothetical protein